MGNWLFLKSTDSLERKDTPAGPWLQNWLSTVAQLKSLPFCMVQVTDFFQILSLKLVQSSNVRLKLKRDLVGVKLQLTGSSRSTVISVSWVPSYISFYQFGALFIS
ncbi:hypothetical protein AB6A40_005320 [Gnathostoma spinigerum]|uniref:Uncharacterized protein n=1 Tax=Gnathostoma spinigerum TaxID=75299 RepID=A0ABD6EMF8_9BILA